MSTYKPHQMPIPAFHFIPLPWCRLDVNVYIHTDTDAFVGSGVAFLHIFIHTTLIIHDYTILWIWVTTNYTQQCVLQQANSSAGLVKQLGYQVLTHDISSPILVYLSRDPRRYKVTRGCSCNWVPIIFRFLFPECHVRCPYLFFCIASHLFTVLVRTFTYEFCVNCIPVHPYRHRNSLLGV